MAILVDMSQVMISNIMITLNMKNSDVELNEDFARHMILNSLRSYRSKFSEEYGELVLCYDGYSSWRKDVFPHYKANRKKNRNADKNDWEAIFKYFNLIRDELFENFPYPSIHLHKAEADDVIATLVLTCLKDEKVLIISGDKDFIQLQTNKNVSQYSPVLKKMITHENPIQFLQEHIIRGDTGDGVPNILSDGDTFVSGKRQAQIRQTFVDHLISSPLDLLIMANYNRNHTLIGLNPVTIPQFLQSEIQEAYILEKQQRGNRKCLFSYFVKHRLSNLIDVIDEF